MPRIKLTDAERAERRKLSGAKYREKNREVVLARSAAWRLENPDKYKASKAAYHNANRAEINKKTAAHYVQYYAANADAVKAKKMAAYLENPAPFILNAQKRRVRLAAIGGKLSPGIAKKLLELQRGKCACCGKDLNGKYHLDHILPLALGGSHADDNMQLLSPRCNLQKNKKHPVDFMQSRGFLL